MKRYPNPLGRFMGRVGFRGGRANFVCWLYVRVGRLWCGGRSWETGGDIKWGHGSGVTMTFDYL